MDNTNSVGQVRGLGSAHAGSQHWLQQRYSAIGNLFLGIWLAVSLALMPNYNYETLSTWIAGPVPSLALALLLVSAFWHARLGLQVVIEDYVHDQGNKFGLLALLNFACVAGAAAGLFSILRIVMRVMAQEAAAAAMSTAMRAAMGGA